MLHKLVDWANIVVTVLTGFYIFLLALFGTEGLKSVPAGLVDSTGGAIIFFFIGGGLVAGNIYLLVKEWKAGGLRKNLRITTDQGTSELSVTALEMLLLRDLRAEPDIVEPGVTITPKGEGKPMLCEVELKLRRQEDVIKRIDAIKRRVRDSIDRLIPGGLTVQVLVEVRDFVSESMRSSSTRERIPESHEFNGPVYSDAGGSDSV